ncbi:hypothetical protein AWC38_SpisGene17000 [Stylophora pistillata]|uniref:Uncharacterized protein n=1 Tax=Stylophora pistillata TaxID=50429 RepID=A0A2B4RQT8_STYPI|nr:hypothetical protein AWC38_SpisGene17000 [Stylophora pistillata]
MTEATAKSKSSREVRASDLYETRKGSPERGKVWDEIAARLNSLSHPKFIVNKRSLRDRLNLFRAKFKNKNREEEKASGISPEVREIDTLLEELSEKEEEAKNKPSIRDKKQNAQQERAKAEEMRLKAMETMGQNKKLVEESDEVNLRKKKRKSTGDAIGFLEKKAEQEMALRRKEIEMKKQEGMRGSQQTTMQQEMLRMIQQQQEDQQKQQQRKETQQLQFLQSMLNQQQQQSQVLLSLIERLTPKENH